jgi:hypothetical protein
MSVDKAKDTSPKKPITENKIVEAKPESIGSGEPNQPNAPLFRIEIAGECGAQCSP